MQVSEQIVDLLLIKNLPVCWHFVSAHFDDIGYAIIVRGHSAHGQILLLENALHTWPLPSTRGVGSVTAVAVIVIDTASGGLLRIEPKFRVTLAALHIARRKNENQA